MYHNTVGLLDYLTLSTPKFCKFGRWILYNAKGWLKIIDFQTIRFNHLYSVMYNINIDVMKEITKEKLKRLLIRMFIRELIEQMFDILF